MLEKIKFTIKAAVLRLKSRPNTKFVHALSLVLRERLGAKYGQAKIAMSRMLKFALTFSVIIVMLCSGAGVYANQSPSVTETHPFYPIKRNIENVREIMAVTPQKKAEIKIEKAAARLEEVDVSGKKNQVAERALRDAENNLADAAKITGKLEAENRGCLIDKIKKLDDSRAVRIEKLIEKRDKNLTKAIKRSIGDDSFLDIKNLDVESIDEALVMENKINNHVRLIKKMADMEDED